MAEQQTKEPRNELKIVKGKRGHQWWLYDHTGAVIAASSQYYASAYAAKRAANRAAVRMHAYGVKEGLLYASAPHTAARLSEGMATMAQAHGNSSASIATRREDVKPKRRFGIFGRG